MNGEHYTYARFWKCALQVNPHGYSGNYRDQVARILEGGREAFMQRKEKYGFDS